MLISYRWLGRHIDLDGLSPQDVVDSYMTHTAEVEGLEPFAPHLSAVTVGHVVEREKHPGADKLNVCKVDLGDGELRQIVCGAPNVDRGQNVAVATVGAVLPGDFKIKKSKIRGVESHGMICSERELELGDNHDGIWVLSPEARVGEPVARALGIEDWVIEIDNKSLTHRPDLWGHRGLASELAAIHKRALKPLDLELPPIDSKGEPYPVRVETPGCSRYLGLVVSNVRVEESPQWLKLLLLAVGQRPLDLLVDISNFVMLDLAQPNHLFDLNRLSEEGIRVRNARAGETMQTLDELERKLTEEDMLICSGDEPVAIAGVMGGEGSKVAPETNDLLLEVASFHATTVRRTSARLGLRTDASARFEKSLDPTLPIAAAAHLVNTLRSIQPDVTLPRPMGDAGTWSDPATSVSLRPERVRAVLGVEISDAEIQDTLDRLGLAVTTGEPWQVAIPSARATKDLAIEEDLIEEVGRIHGYGRIPEVALTGSLEPAPYDPRRMLVRRIQDRLSGPALFHESMTYSFQSDRIVEILGEGEEPHVRLRNPQHEGADRIRRSVLPSLLGHLAKNRRNETDVRLYEVGKGYVPEQASERGEPRELHQVALAQLTLRPGKKDRFNAGAFAAMRGILDDLMVHVGRGEFQWRRIEEGAPSWAHPGRCVGAYVRKHPEPVCVLANLEPRVQVELGLEGELDSEVACAELSIDELLASEEVQARFQSLPRFPGVKVDVALSIPEDCTAGAIERAISRSGKGLVAHIELFDLYRGESVGAGRKSLAYHVLLQADKTLTEKETSKFLVRLERAVEELGGELRKQ